MCGKVRVDNSFLLANLVHPSWKPLRVIDDPFDFGNAHAQVVEMLIGVPTQSTTAMQNKIDVLENRLEYLENMLNKIVN
ncbi:MAG: hypothetical protein EBT68_08750 [Verrucomicrobia bacterium]|nr:hypothetical protein [Verrucomicrobiota bacterium]NBR64219.1 hypothetical protein [Verrucomicrobiota bacterium]